MKEQLRVSIDPELYRRAHTALDRWNEAEQIERARSQSSLSPAEGWRQYVDLWQFCMRLAPPLSEALRWQRLTEWRYYDQLQKLEAWRREHGKNSYPSTRGESE